MSKRRRNNGSDDDFQREGKIPKLEGIITIQELLEELSEELLEELEVLELFEDMLELVSDSENASDPAEDAVDSGQPDELKETVDADGEGNSPLRVPKNQEEGAGTTKSEPEPEPEPDSSSSNCPVKRPKSSDMKINAKNHVQKKPQENARLNASKAEESTHKKIKRLIVKLTEMFIGHCIMIRRRIKSSYQATSGWFDFQENNSLVLLIGLRLLIDSWRIWLVSRQLSFSRRTVTMPQELIGNFNGRNFEQLRKDSVNRNASKMYALSILLMIKTLKIVFNYHPFVWELTRYYGDTPFSRATLYAVFDAFISKLMFLPFAMFGMLFSLYSDECAILAFIGSLIQICVVSIGSGIFMMLLIAITDSLGPDFLFYMPLMINILAITLLLCYILFRIPSKLTPLCKSMISKDLREFIRYFSAHVGFPVEKIYVDHKESEPTAYFMGIFGANMIGVTSSLIQAQDADQVTSVVAHELGHWANLHSPIGLLFSLAEVVFDSYLMSNAYGSIRITNIFRFQETPQAMVPVYLSIEYSSRLMNDIASGFRSIRGHQKELTADRFAVEHGMGDALKSSLLALTARSKSFPVYDSWYSLWFHSHPDIVKRVQGIDNAE